MKNVQIIDYGLGNIMSLKNAIKVLGYNVSFFSDHKKLNSDLVILPGVGAFNYAIKLLNNNGLSRMMADYIKNDNNLLIGICLGMQLFFSRSFENGENKGFGYLEGDVIKLGNNLSILPNVGLRKTQIKKNNFFKGIHQFNNEKFYYVHSYGVENIPNNNEHLGLSSFDEKNYVSITTNKKNILGLQFHPEKSGNIGLELLENVLKK